MVGEPASCRGHLELRDVTFAYPLAKECAVLKGLSFEVEPGSVLALVGASGAGKTTVGRLIERFYDPQQGALLLDGTDFRALELRWLRRQIGFVEQEPILFDCSLMENIKYGRPGASDEAAIAAAERANADAFIRSLPEGYATRPGEKGVRISGGQKQRVAIARALNKAPRPTDGYFIACPTTTDCALRWLLSFLTSYSCCRLLSHTNHSTFAGATAAPA